MTLSAMRLLLRPERGNSMIVMLPIVAFAVATTLALIVIGGARSFWAWQDEYALIYQALAAVAVVLLVVPLGTLGASAARLAARRRDERLSTLRLLGVTPRRVASVAIVESALTAAVGVVAGMLGYLALTPLVGLIPFRGTALGAPSVLLPPLLLFAVCVGMVLLAVVSAVLGLRRVVISPLGVRMRATSNDVHWLRAGVAGAMLVLAIVVAQAVPSLAGAVTITVVLAVLFAGALAVVNVLGPWALKVIAARQARRADQVDRLLAARVVLDSPKAAWRQVSGVAMASFMAVFAGSGVALMDLMMTADAAPQDVTLAADMRTGLIITLAASFVMVAVSVGVTQASDALDQRALYRSLHHLGVPLATVEGARRRAVMSPLLITTLGSALCAAVVVFPLLGAAIVMAPLSLLTIALVVGCGIALVWVSTLATRGPVLRAYSDA